MDKNQKKRITTLLIILVVVVIVAIAAYLLFMTDIFNKKTTKGETVTTKGCGVLEAVDGKTTGTSPFAPNLKGTLGGEYDKNSPICEWTLDDAFYATSKPVNGSCLFSEQNIATKGTHTISYKVKNLTGCPQSIKVTVE
ncbi:MAG: hypothetical protein PHU86_03685 [Patescibacteria group bacterium]|nr:hypothetical protein [Patescibacteria group bacterium]